VNVDVIMVRFLIKHSASCLDLLCNAFAGI